MRAEAASTLTVIASIGGLFYLARFFAAEDKPLRYDASSYILSPFNASSFDLSSFNSTSFNSTAYVSPNLKEKLCRHLIDLES